jgi:outer membrane lipoprotein-sorting protein
MRRVLTTALFLAASLTLAISGEEVMRRVDAHPSPASMQGTMVMQLIGKQGKVLTREIRVWSKRTEEGEMMLIKFVAPADVKGTAFLTIKKGGKEEMKLYLPALKRVRRIAGSQKKGSFMGSDFSYDDISNLSGLDIEDYTHELLRTEKEGGVEVYVVASTPKPGVDSSYSKQVAWVPADTFVPRRIEFYKKDKLYKVLTNREVKPFADGKYLIPTLLEMENVTSGHKTVLEQKDLQIDVPIDDAVFTERFMKKR